MDATTTADKTELNELTYATRGTPNVNQNVGDMNHAHYVIVTGLLKRVENLAKIYPKECSKMEQILWIEKKICYCEMYRNGVPNLPSIFTKTCPSNLGDLREEVELLKRGLPARPVQIR